jgi:2-keto-4-pentenoate hydratase/2-oxohepta-3-ene-1,7-dioic acid hydratase in catechol pathway
VIGRSGTDIASESARDHIFGLTILNDFSARDIQNREMSVGLGPAKGKDFSTATGPWIATLDELPEPYDLKMTAQVDGEVWSEGNTSAMHWRLEEIIAHLSRGEPVRAGELFGTGTVGFGCGLELGRQLRPGNVVELEITGLGRLRNTIGEPPAKEERVASALPAVG